MSSRCLQNMSWWRLQDILETKKVLTEKESISKKSKLVSDNSVSTKSISDKCKAILSQIQDALIRTQ